MDFFFDVPVYRCSEKQFEVKREAYIRRDLYDSLPMRKAFAADPEYERKTVQDARYRYGVWDFNQINGYVRLYFYGDQIRGEWWKTDSKQKGRFVRKELKIVYEEFLPKGSTNVQIYALILEYLRRAQEDRRLRRFHIDKCIFERLGPHVDWNGVYGSANLFRGRKGGGKA